MAIVLATVGAGLLLCEMLLLRLNGMIAAANCSGSLRDNVHAFVNVLMMAENVNRFAIDAIEDIIIVCGSRSDSGIVMGPTTAMDDTLLATEQQTDDEQDDRQLMGAADRCHRCENMCFCRCFDVFTNCVLRVRRMWRYVTNYAARAYMIGSSCMMQSI